jgi:hypothetical protein
MVWDWISGTPVPRAALMVWTPRAWMPREKAAGTKAWNGTNPQVLVTVVMP